jgi:Putative DNA-binding domain
MGDALAIAWIRYDQSTLKRSSLSDFRVMDLNELLKQPEGKTLEFKRDLSSLDGALRTIVAFANTSGGTLLVGSSRRVRSFLLARSEPRSRFHHPAWSGDGGD